MTPLRQSMIDAMELRGLAQRTQRAYVAYLPDERWKLVGRFFIIWLAATIGLYLLGRATGWVVAGFRRPRA